MWILPLPVIALLVYFPAFPTVLVNIEESNYNGAALSAFLPSESHASDIDLRED